MFQNMKEKDSFQEHASFMRILEDDWFSISKGLHRISLIIRCIGKQRIS